MMDNYNTGASQFAGGGFMPSQADGGAAGANSPAQKRAGSQNQTLRAVTVKQLYDGAQNSSDDMHMVDGQEIQNVTLVGKLISAQELATQLKFTLDDGTGTVEVCHWIDSDEGELLAQKKADWRVGTYVRVHGNMRIFESRRTIVAFNIRIILDFNEVTYHLLHCIFQHAHFTSETAKQGGMGQANAGFSAPVQQQQNGSNIGNSLSFDNSDANLTPVQKAVSQVMQTPDAMCSASGVSANEVINALSGRFGTAQIRDAISYLIDEGHMYTTSDEFHYKYASA